MKIPYLVIMTVLIFFISIYLKPVLADNENSVTIENIQTLPTAIIVGQTFKINATLINNSSNPIFVEHGSCGSPFSTSFDNHVVIRTNNVTCTLELIEQRIDPGTKITSASPYLDLTYVAAQNGTVNATVSFQYDVWNQTTKSNTKENLSKPFSFMISPKTRVPKLSSSDNQAIIDVALAIPGLQKWSNDWQFVSMDFMTAKNQPGNWHYAIVNLKASSNSSLIPCNSDWWAQVMIDRTTMKVIQATYPTMESHNCDKITLGGGPTSYGGTISKIDAPLKQFKSGVAANDVKCEQGLQLVIRAEDNSPACTKPQTAQKLVERGWGWAMQPIDSLKPLLSNRIAGLENDTGIVTLRNKTYYFETPNYSHDAYLNSPQISFHNVTFTLFPAGFRGGLPIPCNPQGTYQYYWTDVKFSDNTHELLHIQAESPPCATNPIPSKFSSHTNPQAGLIFYDGKMKLLVSTDNQVSPKENTMPTSFGSCDTSFSQSNTGIAVFYMPENSAGKICVRYYNLNNTPIGVGARIFEANDLTQNAPDITVSASNNTLQGNENTTIVYSIKTGNKTGLYGFTLTCGGTPLAVGYDANSNLTVRDFPWVNQTFNCFEISYDYHIEGTEGIGVRYIPNH